jgi:hypothetical protein
MIGSTYVNKHNGKTIEIEEKLVTDTGTILYYGVNTANGHGEYYSTKNLEEHWVGNAEAQDREMTTKEWERKYFAEFYQWMMDRDVDTCKEFDHVWNAEHGFSTEKVFV